MKYVRFRMDNEVRYGILNGEIIAVLDGDLFGDYVECGKKVELSAVKLLAPCQPSKIMCAGTNYMSHIVECKEKMNLDVEIPGHPLIFSKGPNTTADPDQDVIIRLASTELTLRVNWVLSSVRDAKRLPVRMRWIMFLASPA